MEITQVFIEFYCRWCPILCSGKFKYEANLREPISALLLQLRLYQGSSRTAQLQYTCLTLTCLVDYWLCMPLPTMPMWGETIGELIISNTWCNWPSLSSLDQTTTDRCKVKVFNGLIKFDVLIVVVQEEILLTVPSRSSTCEASKSSRSKFIHKVM